VQRWASLAERRLRNYIAARGPIIAPCLEKGHALTLKRVHAWSDFLVRRLRVRLAELSLNSQVFEQRFFLRVELGLGDYTGIEEFF